MNKYLLSGCIIGLGSIGLHLYYMRKINNSFLFHENKEDKYKAFEELNSEELNNPVSGTRNDKKEKLEKLEKPEKMEIKDENKSQVLLVFSNLQKHIHSCTDNEMDKVYTVDYNPRIQPDYLIDLNKKGLEEIIESKKMFDKIIINSCKCHTNEVLFYKANTLIKECIKLLKPKGLLYLRDIKLYMNGKDPISIEELNDLDMRGFINKNLFKSYVGDFKVMIKENGYDRMVYEEVKENKSVINSDDYFH